MKFPTFARLLFLLAILALTAHPLPAAPAYTAAAIPGTATDLNDAGVVVGNFIGANRHQQAFVWQNGAISEFTIPNAISSTAAAINSRGQVAGTATFDEDAPNQGYVSRNGQLIFLGGYVRPLAINDAGEIVGDYSGHAFFYRNGKLSVGGGEDDNEAGFLDASGLIAGSNTHYDPSGPGTTRTVIYPLTKHGTLGKPEFVHLPEDFRGDGFMVPSGINNRGVVSGSGSATYRDGYRHSFAFLLPEGGRPEIIGRPFPTSQYVSSVKINDRAQVAATVDFGGDDETILACLLDGKRTLDLNTLTLGTVFPSPLKSVIAINNSGQILCGSGYLSSWLLTPVATIKIIGRETLTTSARTVKIHGRAAGRVTQVLYRIGNAARWHKARGKNKWQLLAPLRPGANTITVVAHTPLGDSPPDAITVTRQ